jgi:hypothetical protein
MVFKSALIGNTCYGGVMAPQKKKKPNFSSHESVINNNMIHQIPMKTTGVQQDGSVIEGAE